MPELSVLLCVRDGEQTVGTAVRSTLAAMPRDAELVVLDDGSTDGTRAVLDGFRDRRLRVVEGEGSLGAAGARARLVEVTDSRFFATMDADDVALPWRFAAQRAALARHDADLAFTQVVPFTGPPVRVRRPAVPITATPGTVPLLLLVGNVLYHPTLFARRDAVDAVGGYEGRCVAEDYELWMRAAVAGRRIVRLGLPGLAYRTHDKQVSQSADYFERVAADPYLAAARERLCRETFGMDESVPPGDARIRPVLERELAARGAGRSQAYVVRHFADRFVYPVAAAAPVAEG